MCAEAELTFVGPDAQHLELFDSQQPSSTEVPMRLDAGAEPHAPVAPRHLLFTPRPGQDIPTEQLA